MSPVDLAPLAGWKRIEVPMLRELRFSSEVHAHATADGGVFLCLADGTVFTLPDSLDPSPFALRVDAGATCDVHAGRQLVAIARERELLIAGGPALRRMFTSLHSEACAFDESGERVFDLRRQDDEVRLDRWDLRDACTTASSSLALDTTEDEDAVWSLSEPHGELLPVNGGRGQEGTVTLMVDARGAMRVRRRLPDLVFAGWSPARDAYATVSHYGAQLGLRAASDDRLLIELDLETVFEDIDDGHNWEVLMLGNDRAIVPTSEGRLLMVSLRGEERTEMRLLGDARNWDWTSIVPGPRGTLVTTRSGDTCVRVWDLSFAG